MREEHSELERLISEGIRRQLIKGKDLHCRIRPFGGQLVTVGCALPKSVIRHPHSHDDGETGHEAEHGERIWIEPHLLVAETERSVAILVHFLEGDTPDGPDEGKWHSAWHHATINLEERDEEEGRGTHGGYRWQAAPAIRRLYSGRARADVVEPITCFAGPQ
eukprot:4043588-Prymnesium_polylepis.3